MSLHVSRTQLMERVVSVDLFVFLYSVSCETEVMVHSLSFILLVIGREEKTQDTELSCTLCRLRDHLIQDDSKIEIAVASSLKGHKALSNASVVKD